MTPSTQDDSQLATELRTIVTRLFKKLRTKSPMHAKLSLTERSVIKLLNQQTQMLPSELARHENVTTQSMSQILNHLLELGYITRMPLVTDKRKVMIALSETGQTVIESIRNEVDEWMSKAIRDTCSAEEKAILHQAVGPLAKLLDTD